MENEIIQPYCIMNSNGYVIEKSDDFSNNINGQLSDIIQKSRKILGEDQLNNIEILFENKTILIKDKLSNDLNISMIINNEKK